MTEPNNIDASDVRIEIIPSGTRELVDRELAGESDDIRNETKSLIDAIKKRAQVEAQSFATLNKELYLNAVRNARENIEHNKLVDPDRIEHSIALIQQEAEKNWQSVVNEAAELGDRLADAAKAAWEVLTARRH